MKKEINKGTSSEDVGRLSEEEIKLAEEELSDIKDVADEMSAYSREENDNAIRKYKETGDVKYRNEVITHNIPLVKKVVSKYYRQSDKDAFASMEFEDLVQEGTLGLIKAVEYFDFDFNCSFSTYAYWWIRQAICRYRDNYGNMVRLPVHMSESMKKFKKAEAELLNKNEGTVTLEEIAEKTGMTIDKCKDVALVINNSSYVSLDKEINKEDDNGSTLGSFIEDKSVGVEDDAIGKIVAENALDIIKDILPERNFYIICERYGLLGGVPRTLESIAQELGVTRERIRQIESQSLRRLRHPKYSKLLLDDMSRLRRIPGKNSDYAYN